MKLVKVTRKRQITIPKEISDEIGVKEGDYVRICLDNDKRIIIEKALSLSDLAGALNPGKPLRNLAEDLDLLRKVGERN